MRTRATTVFALSASILLLALPASPAARYAAEDPVLAHETATRFTRARAGPAAARDCAGSGVDGRRPSIVGRALSVRPLPYTHVSTTDRLAVRGCAPRAGFRVRAVNHRRCPWQYSCSLQTG